MEEITHTYIQSMEDTESDTIFIILGSGKKIGINKEQFLKSVLEKAMVTAVEPSNGSNNFILIDGKDYEFWPY